MKTLLSVALLTSACLGFSAQASELEAVTVKAMKVQMANMNQELSLNVNNNIKFLAQTLTMPEVAATETLVAKTEPVVKKDNNGE